MNAGVTASDNWDGEVEFTYDDSKVDLTKVITHRFPLHQMNEAMETNISQQGIKICYIAD